MANTVAAVHTFPAAAVDVNVNGNSYDGRACAVRIARDYSIPMNSID